jgi:hypothetical protein
LDIALSKRRMFQFHGKLGEKVPCAFNEFSYDFRRLLDPLHQANALPDEEIHGLKIPRGVGCGRKSHEAQELSRQRSASP